MVDALQRHDSAFLKAATLRSWGSIDPGHAKLRELVGELIDEGLWRLLWMPPTLPYWPLEGPFEGKERATKRLLFSAWNVVPDVVSAVLSYEAERLMMGGRLDSYEKPDEQQRPLLRLTQSTSGVRSRHRLLLLLLPCLPLADRAHPLDAPAGQDRRAWVRARVEELLADPGLPNPQGGNIDDRWEWAAPLLLDPELPAFLRAWRDDELPRVVGRRASAAAQSGPLRCGTSTICSRSILQSSRSASSGSGRAAHGPRPRLASGSRGTQSEKRERASVTTRAAGSRP